MPNPTMNEQTLGQIALLFPIARFPVRGNAILGAIKSYGPDAVADWAIGIPSKRKGSNCYRVAEYHGWGDFDIYPTSRLRRLSQGYHNLVIRTAMEESNAA